MKTIFGLLIFASAAGCNARAQSSSGTGDSQGSLSGSIGSKATSAKPFSFTLTQAAAEKLRAALRANPGKTHVMVHVDVDGKKYCIGFHYNLEMVTEPSATSSILVESNGVKLAADRQSSEFLAGTTLDWATLESGESGFVFRNPNENKSLPDELK